MSAAELAANSRAEEGTQAIRAIQRSIAASIRRRLANPENLENLDSWAPGWLDRTHERIDELLCNLGKSRFSTQVELAKVLEHEAREYFDYAEAALVLGAMVNAIATENATFGGATPRPAVEALLELHAHALVVADEALTLLRAGFGEGAHARWRTLFEMQITCQSLEEGRDTIGRRYLASAKVEGRRLALAGDLRPTWLGPLTEKEHAAIEALVSEGDAVIAEFGPSIAKNYGWAAPLFDKGDPSFHRLVVLVGEETLYRRYKTASHAVHGNRQGSFRAIAGGPRFDARFAGASSPLFAIMYEVLASLGTIGDCLYWVSDHSLHQMYFDFLFGFAIGTAQTESAHARLVVPASWATWLMTRDVRFEL